MQKETNHQKRITLPARASIWYTIGTVAERAGTMLFTPIFTRILTPEEFGLYPLYISWMGIFTVLCTLEISGSVIYRGLSKFEDKDAFISSSLGLVTTSSLLSLILYMIFRNSINGVTGLSTELTLFLIIQILASGIQSIYFSRCRYEYKYRTVVAIGLISALVTPTLAILLVNLTRIGGKARIIAPLILSIAIALPLAFGIFKKNKSLFSLERWKYILKLSIPELPHFLSTTLSLQIGRIIVGRVFGQGELAKYSVAFSLGFLLSILSSGIASALYPWINRKLLQGSFDIINEVTKKLFFLSATLTLLFLTAVPEIFRILAPSEYANALIAVYPIALSIPFSFFNGLSANVITYYEKTYFLSSASLSSTLITLMLNLMLTLRYGYVAAAFIVPISAAVNLLFVRFSARTVSKKRLFPIKDYIGSALILLAISIPIIIFADVLLARILLGLALIMIILPKSGEYRWLITEGV